MESRKLFKDKPQSARFSESLPKSTDSQSETSLLIKYLPVIAGFAVLFIWALSTTELWLHDRALKQDYEASIAIYQAEWETAQESVAELEQRNVELEKSINDVIREREDLKRDNKKLEGKLNELERQHFSLKQRFQQLWMWVKGDKEIAPYDLAPPGVVYGPQPYIPEARSSVVNVTSPVAMTTPFSPQMPEPPVEDLSAYLKGKVLKVNQVYEFAIVNLGKNDGITVGDKLLVMRDGITLRGHLEVERIYETIAAATMLLEKGVGLEPGDIILYSKS